MRKKFGLSSSGFFVPHEVVVPNARMIEDLALKQRDLSATGGGAVGGYTIQTNVFGLIELLRNTAVVLELGARRLSGLVGNVAIPSQSGGNDLLLGRRKRTDSAEQFDIWPSRIGSAPVKRGFVGLEAVDRSELARC